MNLSESKNKNQASSAPFVYPDGSVYLNGFCTSVFPTHEVSKKRKSKKASGKCSK